MDQGTMITIVVGVLVLAGVAWLVWQRQRQRSEQLRARYGPEYERTVNQVGDKRRADGSSSSANSASPRSRYAR